MQAWSAGEHPHEKRKIALHTRLDRFRARFVPIGGIVENGNVG